jgi:DNA-binding NarL/FixJ family response regulator
MGLLTDFERQVLELTLQGNSAYYIARELAKDPPTVYRSLNNARKKLLEAEKDLEWAKQLGFPEKLEGKPTKEKEPELRATF